MKKSYALFGLLALPLLALPFVSLAFNSNPVSTEAVANNVTINCTLADEISDAHKVYMEGTWDSYATPLLLTKSTNDPFLYTYTFASIDSKQYSARFYVDDKECYESTNDTNGHLFTVSSSSQKIDLKVNGWVKFKTNSFEKDYMLTASSSPAKATYHDGYVKYYSTGWKSGYLLKPTSYGGEYKYSTSFRVNKSYTQNPERKIGFIPYFKDLRNFVVTFLTLNNNKISSLEVWNVANGTDYIQDLPAFKGLSIASGWNNIVIESSKCCVKVSLLNTVDYSCTYTTFENGLYCGFWNYTTNHKAEFDVDLKDITMSNTTSMNAEDCARFYSLSENNGVGAILRTSPNSIDVYNANNWMSGFAYAEFAAVKTNNFLIDCTIYLDHNPNGDEVYVGFVPFYDGTSNLTNRFFSIFGFYHNGNQESGKTIGNDRNIINTGFVDGVDLVSTNGYWGDFWAFNNQFIDFKNGVHVMYRYTAGSIGISIDNGAHFWEINGLEGGKKVPALDGKTCPGYLGFYVQNAYASFKDIKVTAI